MDEKDKRIKKLEQQVAELNERIAFLTSKLFRKKLKKRTVFRKMTDNQTCLIRKKNKAKTPKIPKRFR